MSETITHEKALEIIDVILNEGVQQFVKELPKKAERLDCVICNDDLFIYFDKWEKIKKKYGLVINVDSDGLYIWRETWEKLYID